MMHGKQELPILNYHSIDRSGSVISVSPETFHQQMALLNSFSIRVIPLREVISHIRERRPLPPKSVALTFDDGYRNIYEVAYPILQDLGFPATVFVIAGRIGRDNRWLGQPIDIPTMDLLDWDQIREMTQNGIDFGAHTMTHPDLSQISPRQAVDEVMRSKSVIRDQTGKDVHSFAYPYGTQTASVRDIIRELFDGACSTQLACVKLRSELYALPRIDMYYFSRSDRFRMFGTAQFARYLQWRNILRSVRTCFMYGSSAYHRFARNCQ